MRLDEDFHGSAMDAPVFSCYEPVGATLMSECAFRTIMEPGPSTHYPRQRLHHRRRDRYSPVGPTGTGARAQDRAKAAKLRHRAAKARLKANHLEERTRHLRVKADQMERRRTTWTGSLGPGRRTAQR